jgi:hypothetical protein
MEGMHSLLIEIAPGLAIQRVIDLALKSDSRLEPGILAVERQFGILELHSKDVDSLKHGGQAILNWLNAKPSDQLKPQLLYNDLIEDVTDQHAVIINRTRQANMLLPGQSLLIMEVAPALFGAYMANEAEKAAPTVSLVECSMIGASGRMYLAGDVLSLKKAQSAVVKALGEVIGR